MELQCLANGRIAGTGESILGLLNPCGVSNFYEMGIDSQSTAIDSVKKAHITDGFQTGL